MSNMQDYRPKWLQEKERLTCNTCQPPHTFDSPRSLRYHKKNGHVKVDMFTCGSGHEHYSLFAANACDTINKK